MKRACIYCVLSLAMIFLPSSAASSRQSKSRILTLNKPRGRALLVGVNQYQVKEIRKTPGSIEDAEATAKLLREKEWFAPGEIMTLLGQQATAANIERQFK